MAFDLSNVKFLAGNDGTELDGFQQSQIRGYLYYACTFSDTAQKMFEKWGKTINIKFEDNFRAGNPPAQNVGSGIIYINPSYLTGISYINDTGTALQYSLFGGVIHEISHALTGKIDNTTETDYQGDNVRNVNKIWEELRNTKSGIRFSGLDKMISYLGEAPTTPEGELQKIGYDYTNKKPIDAAANVGFQLIESIPGVQRIWDSSKLPGLSRDLLIGGPVAESLYSGAGNDFLFGGGGADTLDGGTGIDTAVYYGPSRNYKYDPIKNSNGSLARNSDGSLKGWIVKNIGDEGAGTDTLFNIEKIQFDGDILNLGPKKTLTLNSNGTVSQKYNDFNNDGNSDILWRNNDGSVAIWQLDGTTVTPKSVGSLTSDWTIAGTGDFNGDLSDDILLRNANGNVATWELNDSTLTTSSTIGNVTADWKIAGTGDFNADSESDILWRNDNGTVAVWTISDSAVIEAVILGTVSTDWKIAGTGDFNADSESDILWRNDNGTVALWTVNDSAYTDGAVIGTVTSDWKIAETADFDGDGDTDILWRNDNGTVALWQMDGSNITAGSVVGTVSADWKIAGSGDFNSDGNADILWHNDNGSVATWQMNGKAVLSASLTSIPSAATSWNIA